MGGPGKRCDAVAQQPYFLLFLYPRPPPHCEGPFHHFLSFRNVGGWRTTPRLFFFFLFGCLALLPLCEHPLGWRTNTTSFYPPLYDRGPFFFHSGFSNSKKTFAPSPPNHTPFFPKVVGLFFFFCPKTLKWWSPPPPTFWHPTLCKFFSFFFFSPTFLIPSVIFFFFFL